MSAPSAPEELLAALAAERAALAALAAVLEREQALLAGPDPQAIEAIAAEKELAAQRTEACAAARARLAPRPDAAQGEIVEQAWRELLAAARTARAANDANGRLIALQARFAQARLAALAGPAPGAAYGPDGAVTAQGTGRALGAA